MQFKNILGVLLLAISSLALATPSKAAFVLNVHDGAVFAPSNVVVNPGDLVTVNFLLTQSSEIRLDDPATGLLSAFFTATASGTDITPTSVALNPSFIDAGSTGVAGQVATIDAFDNSTFLGTSGTTTANDTSSLDPSGESVVIGSATFTVSLTATGTHTVTIVPEKDGFGSDLFSLADPVFPPPIDIDEPTTFTFTVSAVPEPSGCVVLMLACGAISLSRRRRA